jgi:hypothetical protein
MAAGTIWLVAAFETRASFDKLRSALLRTRPMRDIDMIQTMETRYYRIEVDAKPK